MSVPFVRPASTLLGHRVGLDRPFFLICGPCVIESEEMTLRIADTLRGLADRLGLLLIFKASFDKANRSSGQAFRGPGLEEGLRILEAVRSQVGIPVLTDVHEASQATAIAQVVDVLQTPAFLARQTDFIAAIAATGKPLNIKKAQFMAPRDMIQVVAKARAGQPVADPGAAILVCERGASFGYNNLVSDMRSLALLRETGCPVVFDATHSVQLPGANATSSGGDRRFVPVLARAAVAAGVAGLFLETHPDPDHAFSDGPNSWPLDRMEPLLRGLIAIDRSAKEHRFFEEDA